MIQQTRSSFIACFAALLIACGGGNPSPTDSGIDGATVVVDAASATPDARVSDAGASVDAVVLADAGMPGEDAGSTDAGPPSCKGTPLACVDLSQGQCIAGNGCSFAPGGCSGTPRECDTSQVRPTCIAQQGCQPSGDGCTGTPVPCAEALTCFNHMGCTQELGTCSSVGSGPAPCAERATEKTCDTQPGCRWE